METHETNLNVYDYMREANMKRIQTEYNHMDFWKMLNDRASKIISSCQRIQEEAEMDIQSREDFYGSENTMERLQWQICVIIH